MRTLCVCVCCADNSLQALGDGSAAVFYDHGWGATLPSKQFMMRIETVIA